MKKVKSTTNSNKKTFTPKEEGIYIFKMRLGKECFAEKQAIVGNPSKAAAEENGKERNNTLEIILTVNGLSESLKEDPAKSFEKDKKNEEKDSLSARPKSKAAALVIWLLLFLLSLFCVVLIWRR